MSIEAYPSPNGVLTSLIWRKTAAGGETSLSGYDNASQALSYTPGQEQVYLNGILLVRGSDYTATNGTSITSLTALAVDDFVQINCYNNFSVASVPAASITGEVTNSQITSLATTKLTGTITNAQLAGSIANDKLANSSITINGSAVALGGSATIAGGSAQDTAPSSPTEGQLWLDTDGTLATTAFVEKSTLTTTGDLLYASSANTPARIGIGSSAQVLTVASGVPSWATPASGGMTLISETVASSLSSLSFSSLGSHKQLLLVWHGIQHNAASNIFNIRFNSDSGSNYIWFNNYWGGGHGHEVSTQSYACQQGIAPFGYQTSGAGADEVANGFLLLDNYTSTTKSKAYQIQNFMRTPGDTAGDSRGGNTTGYYNSTSAITSIDVFRQSGSSTFSNYSNTTIRLYGLS